MKAAVRTWGPVAADVREIKDGVEHVLAFQHNGSDIVTFVDSAPGASAVKPTAISMGKTANGSSLRFHTVQGTPLADITRSGSSVKATPAATGSAAEPGVTVPRAQYFCFISCMGAYIEPGCADSCFNCGPTHAGAVNCAHCAYCAGPKAIKCAKDCFNETKVV